MLGFFCVTWKSKINQYIMVVQENNIYILYIIIMDIRNYACYEVTTSLLEFIVDKQISNFRLMYTNEMMIDVDSLYNDIHEMYDIEYWDDVPEKDVKFIVQLQHFILQCREQSVEMIRLYTL